MYISSTTGGLGNNLKFFIESADIFLRSEKQGYSTVSTELVTCINNNMFELMTFD